MAEIPEEVFIAEAVWFEENPVDGRNRIAVTTSLEAALEAISGHPLYGDANGAELVATEMTESALGSEAARTWAVHEQGEEPGDFGHLWITCEPLTGQPEGGTEHA